RDRATRHPGPRTAGHLAAGDDRPGHLDRRPGGGDGGRGQALRNWRGVGGDEGDPGLRDRGGGAGEGGAIPRRTCPGGAPLRSTSAGREWHNRRLITVVKGATHQGQTGDCSVDTLYPAMASAPGQVLRHLAVSRALPRRTGGEEVGQDCLG